MKRLALSLVLILFALCLFPAGAASQPLPDLIFPKWFYGSVTIDGNPAPVGTSIFAKIGDTNRGNIVTEVPGLYGGPSGGKKLVAEGEIGDEGRTISFYIRTFRSEFIKANEVSVFESGVVEELGLTFPPFCGDKQCTGSEDCSSCSYDCGDCPSPPSGGVPSGVYTPPPTACEENWTCSDWSACVNWTQERVCEDENGCGTEEDRPEEERACVVEEPEEICIAGVRVCAGNDVVECSEDRTEWVKIESCEFGCADGGCVIPGPGDNATGPSDGFMGGLTGLLTGNFILTLYGVFIVILIILGILFYVKLR
jgi:hypothetical protein